MFKPNTLFVILLVALIIGLWNNVGTENLAAEAIREPIVPHIELLSPDKGISIFREEVKFAYRVKAIDYETACSLLINGQPRGASHSVVENAIDEFRESLQVGYYKWRVQCKLLNGRTISSQEWNVKVAPEEDLNKEFRPTGRVIASEEYDPDAAKTGFVVVLVGLCAFIWGVNIYRESQRKY